MMQKITPKWLREKVSVSSSILPIKYNKQLTKEDMRHYPAHCYHNNCMFKKMATWRMFVETLAREIFYIYHVWVLFDYEWCLTMSDVWLSDVWLWVMFDCEWCLTMSDVWLWVMFDYEWCLICYLFIFYAIIKNKYCFSMVNANKVLSLSRQYTFSSKYFSFQSNVQ
jgi:hypothetical protein